MAAAPPRLGDLLIEQGLITPAQLDFTLREQKATAELMGACLIRLGMITDTELAVVLSKQGGNPFIDLRNFLAAEQVYRITGFIVKTHIAASNLLKKMIDRFYYLIEHPIEDEIRQITDKLRTNPNLDIDVQQLVHNLLGSAISWRVTDIHITPSDKSCRIMFRIDGVMKPNYVFPRSLHSRITTNVKVQAGMDIAEQRKPQDGRMSFDFFGESFDIRVSSVRTRFGENLVLRLLPSRGGSTLGIRELGYSKERQEQLRRLFKLPYGMILVCGPTGSGKTTTLYAALREQDSIGKNILTVEDPIEYELLMIRQTQVNTRAGYTFASAIRTFLRQDPDVMLIGEIRDEETARLAVRAALTGHLVLSTLHSNTAIAALARLKDLGLSPYLLSTSLKGILAQRLVRRLCTQCRRPVNYDPEELKRHNLPTDGTYFAAGRCAHCQQTGYLGRDAISELVPVTDTVMRLVAQDASPDRIEDACRKEGFTSLYDAGRKKVAEGITSFEELRRVLG